VRAALLALLACGSPATAPPPPAARKTDVHVDKRLELMAIVQRLAGNRGYVQGIARPYLDDVDQQFARYFDHPAVKATRDLFARGTGFEKPLQLALCLDDHFVPRCELDKWHELDDYRAQLKAFAEVSKFDDFFAAHAGYYKDVGERIATTVDAEKPAEWFESLFGRQAGATYTVVPGLVEGPWSFSIRAELPDRLEIVEVLGVDHVDSKHLPVLGEAAIETLVHEMAHAYVNPVLARHERDFAHAGAVFFGLTSKPMRRQAYTTWQIVLAESVVRAATVLYVRDKKGTQAAADATRDQVRRGFAWTTEITDALARQRKLKRADFESFVPSLVGTVENLAARDAHGLPAYPFYGPIDAALDADPLGAFYGTPDDKDIANVMARGGWVVNESGIELGARKFAGPGLVLVACYPRKDDPTRGVVVHVAARKDDLAGIDDVRRGGTDWMVARRQGDHLEVVAQGDFPHATDGAWLPAK